MPGCQLDPRPSISILTVFRRMGLEVMVPVTSATHRVSKGTNECFGMGVSSVSCSHYSPKNKMTTGTYTVQCKDTF